MVDVSTVSMAYFWHWDSHLSLEKQVERINHLSTGTCLKRRTGEVYADGEIVNMKSRFIL